MSRDIVPWSRMQAEAWSAFPLAHHLLRRKPSPLQRQLKLEFSTLLHRSHLGHRMVAYSVSCVTDWGFAYQFLTKLIILVLPSQPTLTLSSFCGSGAWVGQVPGRLWLDVSQNYNHSVSSNFCYHKTLLEVNQSPGSFSCPPEGLTSQGLLTWMSSGLLLWHMGTRVYPVTHMVSPFQKWYPILLGLILLMRSHVSFRHRCGGKRDGCWWDL